MASQVQLGRSRWWPIVFLIGSLLLCVVAYLPALTGDFVFDDVGLLERHECWRGLDKIPAMFGFGEPNACTYRPMRYVTYALDYEIGGVNPLVIHISNLIYHLLTALGVYVLFRRWASVGAATLMMALWAVHPVLTDAVAYMSGRRDIVSTLLYVLAFLLLMPPKGKRLTALRVVFGIALYYLALRAKEMAVTLPAVLIWAVVASHAGRLSELVGHLKRRWAIYGLLLTGAVAFVVFRAVVDSHSRMGVPWWGDDAVTNFATVFTLYARYLWLVLWPAKLIGDYYFTLPFATSFLEPMVILGIAIYAAMLALIVVSLRRGWQATAFGLGWFLITMLPVSHIFPHHELFAEHYLYLPLIGLAAALLPLAQRLLSVRATKWRVCVAVGIVALTTAYAARTSVRSVDFRTEMSFYSKAHELAPHNTRIAFNLGLVYLRQGDCEEAVPLLLQATQRARRGHPIPARELNPFINCVQRMGRTDLLDEVVDALLAADPLDPLGLVWHGRRLFEEGSYEAAARDLAKAVEITSGEDADVVTMLARALIRDGDPQRALEVLRQYPHENQQHCEQEVDALTDLGIERYSEAFDRSQACLRNFPNSLILLEIRAGLLLSAGRPDLAAIDIERMERLDAPVEVLQRLRRMIGNPQ